MALRLYENFRAVFYAPFYAADALGAYQAEGLEVAMSPAPGVAESMADLRAGRVDVCWGGPMRILRARDQCPGADFVCFCEVVARDPFHLVGRTENPGFRLSELVHHHVATVCEVPTAWMCLQHDLRCAGVDPAAVRRTTDRTMPENIAALEAGAVDVVQVFEPFPELLMRDGRGHIWYSAATRGLTAYTAFYTTRGVLEARRDELLAMTRAMYRTQKWVHAQTPETVADAIADYLPDVSRDVLAASIARCQRLEIWGRDPLLERDGFERLKASFMSGGMISKDVPYEDAVDTGLAERTIRDDPPILQPAPL